MSVDARARGSFTYASPSEAVAVAEGHDDEELQELVDDEPACLRVDGCTVHVDIDAGFSNHGNLSLQMWLEDLAEEAESGSVLTWQEGMDVCVRLHAGGDETEEPGPFPEAS